MPSITSMELGQFCAEDGGCGGSPGLPREDLNRRRSSPIVSLPRLESLNRAACRTTIALSPPPTPRSATTVGSTNTGIRLRRETLNLRSGSGLSMHTNAAALRQYTDYHKDGSPMMSHFADADAQDNGGWDDGGDRLSRLDSGVSFASKRRGSVAPTHVVWNHSNGSNQLLLSPMTSTLPDFFTRDVLQMVLQNPTTFDRLLRFAESRNTAEGMEFLMQLKEYNRCVNSVTSSMATISTTYTSVAATSSLNLPSQLSRNLNADVKHITTSILPGLEMLFLEARFHIEQRVLRDIYPDFVKQQLVLSTEAALRTDRRNSPSSFDPRFPGLADAFCMTDPLLLDNPITFASDGMVEMTGYEREDIIGHNARFLQGGLTHHGSVGRIRDIVAAGSGGVLELVLNYRSKEEDGSGGQPFWNLMFICPLTTSTGRVAHYLGGQINISEAIGSYKEIVDILGLGTISEPSSPTAVADDDHHQIDSLSQPGDMETSKWERRFQRKSKNDQQEPHQQARKVPSTRGFSFKPFRKQSSESTSVSRAQSPQRSSTVPTATSMTTPPSVCRSDFSGSGQSSSWSRSTTPQPQLTPSQTAAATELLGAYTRHMVLSYAPYTRPAPDVGTREPEKKGGSTSHKNVRATLKVEYFSTAVLEILGIPAASTEGTAIPAELFHQDIFTLITEQARSPSMTKQFRCNLTERLSGGQCVSTRITVGSSEPPPAANRGDGGSSSSSRSSRSSPSLSPGRRTHPNNNDNNADNANGVSGRPRRHSMKPSKPGGTGASKKAPRNMMGIRGRRGPGDADKNATSSLAARQSEVMDKLDRLAEMADWKGFGVGREKEKAGKDNGRERKGGGESGMRRGSDGRDGQDGGGHEVVCHWAPLKDIESVIRWVVLVVVPVTTASEATTL